MRTMYRGVVALLLDHISTQRGRCPTGGTPLAANAGRRPLLPLQAFHRPPVLKMQIDRGTGSGRVQFISPDADAALTTRPQGKFRS